MIAKEKIKEKVEKYLKEKNIQYTKLATDVNKITLWKNDEILWGKRKGEIIDIYTYPYLAMWTQEEKYMGVHVDAKTGELLYIMTPHGCIDIED